MELLTELNEHEKEIAYYGTIGKGLELPDKSSHAYRQREVVSSKVKKTLSDEWSVRSKGRYNRSSKQRLKRNHTLAPLRLSECKTNFEQSTAWSNRHTFDTCRSTLKLNQLYNARTMELLSRSLRKPGWPTIEHDTKPISKDDHGRPVLHEDKLQGSKDIVLERSIYTSTQDEICKHSFSREGRYSWMKN